MASQQPYRSGTAIGMLFALGLVPLPVMAQELPSSGSVTSGTATITTSGANLLVNQSSQNAILSWQSFSVGGGASAHFENGSGATLNRVTGNLPSSIDGSLTATGSLYLVNPAGVVVGTGGMIRTGGSFVASTHDAADADFLDGGALTLKGTSKASVVNQGFVTSLSGDVVLTARRVENSGTIEAPNGSVGLLGGYEVELRDTSLADGKFAVKVGGSDTEVVNSGTVRAAEVEMRANGGSVQALAGNTKAIVKATGVKKVGGRIFLTAGSGGTVRATQRLVARRATQATRTVVAALPDIGPLPAARPDFSGGEVRIAGGTVSLGGSIDAAGAGGPGGTITATAGGGSLSLLSTAVLDASGRTGGLVLLGGDYQGGADPATRYLDMPMERAAATSVAAGATIAADGSEGDGGAVVVWSDGATTVKGQITAKGGTTGDGGTVETSGHVIDFTDARIDASAQNGLAGTWLVDPVDLVVTKAAAETAESMLNNGTNATFVTRDSSAGGPNGYVTSTGPGDITIAAPITWSTGATLTLDAYHSIVINAPITVAGAGGLALLTNQGGGSGGTLSFAGGVQYTGSGGSLTINSQPYTLVYDMAGLQNINANLIGNYALAKSLDASAIPANGAGEWIPLGTSGAGTVLNGGNGFAGAFTGLGNTISNLTVDTGNSSYAGLFGYSSGNISDIGLIGGSVTGGGIVGGLIGRQAGGSLTQAYATGAVSGAGYVGGLVGYQTGGSITDSYATGKVDGGTGIYVGGLVGYQLSSITQAYATGAVSGASYVGGLVGWQNGGSLTQAYATGKVDGSGNMVGGLVGLQTGSISQSYATGAVRGTGSYVGGLVGYQSGSITQAYATGAVAGSAKVGGLVGYQLSSITQAYASGAVTGSTDVGGLVGDQLSGSITAGYFDSYSTGQLIGVGGGAQTGVTAVTSDPGQSGAANYAYKHSAYTGNIDPNNDLTFTATPGGSGWYMIEGQTRPFGAWEYSTAIANGHQLQLVNMDFGASYTLVRDIDLAGEFGRAGVTSPSAAQSAGMWNGGFVPLGTGGSFTGNFSGLGHTIGNLIVDVGTATYAGLFAHSSGNISDLGLVGGSVKGGSRVGGLVGTQNGGSIARVFNTGTVTGSGHYIGGLVGVQAVGSIEQSYATGAVNGVATVGGLVGWQDGGSIAQAYATGAVSGTDIYVGGLVGYQTGGNINQAYATGVVTGTTNVGGLVGRQYGSIEQSYATGTVTGTGDGVGGLVGQAFGSIEESYATGAVAGGNDVGGLAGVLNAGTVKQSHATGAVVGGQDVGGLVGEMANGTSLIQSYASGSVLGTVSVGGLVGNMDGGGIARSYATGAVVASANYVGGLVGYQRTGLIEDSYASGSVRGDHTLSYMVGGLVGSQSVGGTVKTSYATGVVTGANFVGGLIGAASGTATDSYFDSETTGQSGAGGLTTVQLQAALQANFDPTVWGILSGISYPYLKWRFPTGPSVVSGTAADIAGGNGGLGVGLGINGAIAAYGHTGANGTYNFMVDPAVAGSSALAWLTGERFTGASTASRANAVGEMPASGLAGFPQGMASGLDLYAETVNVKTALPTYTDIATMMARALYGDGTGVPLTLQLPDVYVLRYDGSCGCDVSFFPGDLNSPQASVRIDASAPLLTWDGVFDSLFPPLNTTILAAGDVLVTTGNGIGADDINGVGGGLVTMTVNGNLTLESDSGIGSGTGSLALTVKGDLSLNADAVLVAFGGDLNATVGGNVTLGGAPNSLVQILALNSVRLSAGGDFTMAPEARVVAAGSGDAIQVAVGGKFDNQVGADALLVDPNNARWLVYLATPAGGHEFGGLDSGNTAVWNTAAFAPVAAAGNRYVFGYQPTLTFTSADASKTYGEPAAPFGYSVNGLMSGVAGAYLGDTAAAAYSGAPLLSSAGSPSAANVGTYTITAVDNGLISTAGYAFAFDSAGLLTVSPAVLTVTAADGTMVYGGPAPGLSYSVGGWKNGQGDSLLNGVTVTTDATSTSNVGTSYVTTASGGTLSGAATGNYIITYAGGHLTVIPRPLIITANAASRVYGGANPIRGGAQGDNLVNGDALAYVTLNSSATPASGVGSYDLTGSGAVFATGLASNYAITYATQTGGLSVTPRSVTVTADDQRRPLGAPDPALTWTITGGSLASFDAIGGVFSGSLARAPGEDVGVYAIGRGTFAVNANYALTFLPGTFTIGSTQYVASQVFDRQNGEDDTLLLSSGAGENDGAVCTTGVLGQDCVPHVNPGNRDLGPYISTQ